LPAAHALPRDFFGTHAPAAQYEVVTQFASVVQVADRHAVPAALQKYGAHEVVVVTLHPPAPLHTWPFS
jgi:hypothetical protein